MKKEEKRAEEEKAIIWQINLIISILDYLK